MPATPTVETPGGGLHFHFAAPAQPVSSVNGLRPGVDLKAEGGIVLLPPSVLQAGPYTWRGGYWAQPELAPLPPVIRRWLAERSARTPTPLHGGRGQSITAAKRPAPPEGGRDIAGVLSRLQRVKQTSRNQWVAGCPGPNHRRGDRRPSLGVAWTPEGRLLLHCFGAPGCRYEQILGALGL